ncbi:hypothetical protein O6H91_18G046800 [Diphasiastrum complanatum]|uniref:Uncharacterized protein n=1 Tax=Diphasiastrum complanatum TaxID=34168 RepID=A0ACC2B0T4_DIPCM|nr:hypothetical protein O6H91_18G046800 [Diphasiastrum complanatum]
MENVKRPPKPPNYKKKTLVYVSATSNNKFMLNMSADRKLVPVSYEVLTRGIQQLHVVNALYKEGMHFFGGIPRVGAYFVVPITLKTAPSQVAALLCADTLKVERYGTGRPFSESDVIFITAIADSISDVMNANHSKITNKPMTEVLIKRIQVQLQQIKDQREETLKKAIADTKALQRLSKLEVQGNNQGDDDKEHKDDEELDEGKDEVEEGQEEGEEDEVEEEEEMAEDDAKAEDEEEEEVYPEEGEDAIKDRRKLYLKDLRKEIAKYRKMVTIAEKNCEKLKNAIEIRGQKVGRLEVKLSKSKDYIQHFQNLLAIVIETIIEVKETEQPQILCWPFPSTNIFRILKGVLHILGYTKEIVENWVKVREIIKTSFYNELKHYDASQEKDLVKWNFGDKCIDVVADVELESMVAELEVKALFEELSKMMNKEKELMDVMKVAKEQKVPNETNDVQERDNVSKENDEEGEEEDVEEDNGE